MRTLEGRNIKLVNKTDLDDNYLKDLLYPDWQKSIECWTSKRHTLNINTRDYYSIDVEMINYDNPNKAILNILSVKKRENIPGKKVLNKDFIMTFGKWKGETIETVTEFEPKYLFWCSKNIEWFNLDVKLQYDIEAKDIIFEWAQRLEQNDYLSKRFKELSDAGDGLDEISRKMSSEFGKDGADFIDRYYSN